MLHHVCVDVPMSLLSHPTPPHPHPHPPTQCYVDSMIQRMTTVASLPDARHLKQAYANAYVSYAICMGAYAWGVICLVAVEFPLYLRFCRRKENKMQPTSPNAHTYVKGTDVETHEYAVTQNTFLKQFFFEQSCAFFPVTIRVHRRLWNMEESGMPSVECGVCKV